MPPLCNEREKNTCIIVSVPRMLKNRSKPGEKDAEMKFEIPFFLQKQIKHFLLSLLSSLKLIYRSRLGKLVYLTSYLN